MKLSEEEIEIECNKLLITLKNSHIDGKIIQILYDLYEQEKEKNKELEKENWIMRTVDKQYISKDKIKKYYIKILEKQYMTIIMLMRNCLMI